MLRGTQQSIRNSQARKYTSVLNGCNASCYALRAAFNTTMVTKEPTVVIKIVATLLTMW